MRTLHALLFIACWILIPAAPAETLKIATISPDGTSWMTTMREAAAEIERRTDGRVGLRFYPGGVMGSDKSVLRKIRVGQLHGGAVTGGALADLVPDAQVYGIPFLFRDLDEVDTVRKELDPYIIEKTREAGLVSFGLAEGGFAYLMSNAPLRTLDDVKGHRVWAPEGDRVARSAFEALGISPVSLPLTDVLTGLQTSLIDTVATTPAGAIALQWHTQVRFVTDLPLTYIYGTLVIAERPFARIAAPDRKVLQEVLGDTFRRLDQQSREENRNAWSALAGQGIGTVSPTENNGGDWQGVAEDSIRTLERERYFSPGLVERVKGLLVKARAKR